MPAPGWKLHVLSAYSARIPELGTGQGGAGMRLNSFYDSGAGFLTSQTHGHVMGARSREGATLAALGPWFRGGRSAG